MARADFPAFDIGPMWDDAVPPYDPDFVRLGIEHVFFEVAHQGALLGKVGLAEHFAVEIQLLLVFEIPVISRINRTLQVRLDIDKRVWDAMAIGPQSHLAIATPL